MVWIDQTSYKIPSSQNLIQSKAIILFNSVKIERGEETTEKSLKLADVGSWGLRRETVCNISVQGEAVSADIEVATSYPEDLAKIFNEYSYTKQQVLNIKKIVYIGNWCHPELS